MYAPVVNLFAAEAGTPSLVLPLVLERQTIASRIGGGCGWLSEVAGRGQGTHPFRPLLLSPTIWRLRELYKEGRCSHGMVLTGKETEYHRHR